MERKNRFKLPLILLGIILVIIGGTIYYAETLPTPKIEFVPENAVQNATSTHGIYVSYSPDLLSHASNGPVILFFNASWCPTCHTLDSNIKSHLSDIPQNMTILSVDYDTSTKLKVKYGITYQHVLIQVDENGDQLKRWEGTLTLQGLIDTIL